MPLGLECILFYGWSQLNDDNDVFQSNFAE